MSDRYRSRSSNVILVRDDVGKAKPTCYDLPGEEFAYGRPDNPDFEGAREVTMQWISHVPRPRAEEKMNDFKKINKAAIGVRVANAKQLADFRRGAGNALTISPPAPPGPPPKVIPSDVVPAFTYGKKTRPSTPIAAVVSYQFSAEYEQALDENYEQYDEEAFMMRGMRRIKTTKATEGHASRSRAQAIIPKEPFRMKKFQKVGPSFKLPDRDKEMREKAGLQKSCSLPAIPGASM